MKISEIGTNFITKPKSFVRLLRMERQNNCISLLVFSAPCTLEFCRKMCHSLGLLGGACGDAVHCNCELPKSEPGVPYTGPYGQYEPIVPTNP